MKNNSLEKAVQNLAVFARHSQSLVANHVVDLAIREGELIPATQSTLKKTFDRVGYLISTVFSATARSEYAEKSKQVQNIIVRDLNIVREHTHEIERLSNGSQEERQLAHAALNTIKQYNSILDSVETDPHSSSAKLACFIHDQTEFSTTTSLNKYRIELPPSTFERNEDRSLTGIDKENRSHQAFQSQEAVRLIFQNKLIPSSIKQSVSDDPFLVVELDMLRTKAFARFSKSQREIGKLIKAIHNGNAPLKVETTPLDSDTSSSEVTLSIVLPSNESAQIIATFLRFHKTNNQSKPRSQLQTIDFIMC